MKAKEGIQEETQAKTTDKTEQTKDGDGYDEHKDAVATEQDSSKGSEGKDMVSMRFL